MHDGLNSNNDDSDDSDEEIELPLNLVELQGLPLDPRKAGYKDYIDYLNIMKTDREELKISVKEIKEKLSYVSDIQSRTLSQLKDQLSSMSFTVGHAHDRSPA